MKLTNEQRANPLINPPKTKYGVPAFDQIRTEHFLPAIEWAIDQAREQITAIKRETRPDFTNTVEALELAQKDLTRVLSILGQYQTVLYDDALDTVQESADKLVNAFNSDIAFDSDLFQRVRAIYNKRNQLGLDHQQLALLKQTYNDYVNDGALLPADKQDELRRINDDLSAQYQRFRRNLSKAAREFQIVIDDEVELAGLPQRIKDGLKKDAEDKGLHGKWLVTAKAAVLGGILSYAENRSLRKKAWMYRMKQGHQRGADNRPVVKRILELRHKKALLLNGSRPEGQKKYRHFADFVLKDKMAGNVQAVHKMLRDMSRAAMPVARAEHRELMGFIRRKKGPKNPRRWDYSYYGRQLQEEKYGFNPEDVRPYFAFENVAKGVFGVAEKMYDITIRKTDRLPTYHKDATPHEVVDNKTGAVIGVLYTDFFPRPGTKKTGAWAGYYRRAHEINGQRQVPIVGIHGNFTEPTPGKPSLLSFAEATTFIHELGHALHNLLSQARYESQSGSRVKHDFVELPSQIMENWLKEKEVLDMFARHYADGSEMPADLLNKMLKSQQFETGTAFLAQLQYATLDMALHTTDPDKIVDILEFEKQVTAQFRHGDHVPGTGMATSFGHLFDGAAYAAGYYDYKWAEMLEADAFDRFKQEGLFNRKTASEFRKLLAAGGTRDPMELFREFRGREPSIEPLLVREGLKPSSGSATYHSARQSRKTPPRRSPTCLKP